MEETELVTCVRVLRRLSSSAASIEAVATTSAYRDLRKAMAPIVSDAMQRRHGGLAPMEYARRRQLRKEAEARQSRQSAQDERYVETRQLRAGRLARLGALADSERERELAALADDAAASEAPLKRARRVLDGAVDTVALGLADLPATEGGGSSGAPDGAGSSSSSGSAPQLHRARQCYTCKRRFVELHHFYDLLCPRCGNLNWKKRLQTTDLRGRVAVVTGGRVKIGFETALKLLRGGATVVVTSRFPRDAVRRFAAARGAATWLSKLQVCGVDFRDMRQIDRFCATLLARFDRLDILIHNACQTIRRPRSYYAHLVAVEDAPAATRAEEDALSMHATMEAAALGGQPRARLEDGAAVAATSAAIRVGASSAASSSAPTAVPAVPAARSTSVRTSQIALTAEDADPTTSSSFPARRFDVNGQQLDTRTSNSWLLKIGDVAVPEVAEVFAINTLAPFVITSRLLPLIEAGGRAAAAAAGGGSSAATGEGSARTRSRERTAELTSPANWRWVINVGAMEGKFYRHKTANHPHTNMAKAALNMMTRTCASDLATRGVYMCSVDTGWINDENPMEKAARHAEASGFATPIDEIDAAARIVDPIFGALLGVGGAAGSGGGGGGGEGGAEGGEEKGPAKSSVPPFGVFLKDFVVTEW